MWVGLGSAAAVLVAFVIGVSVLTGGGGGGDETTTFAAGPPAADQSGPAPTNGRSGAAIAAAGSGEDSASSSPSAAGPGPGRGRGGGVDGGDLGDIADAAALTARARSGTLQLQSGGATAGPAPALAESASPPVVPKAVGTRPCEMEARAARSDLATVVYYATGRVNGLPVVVLGFGPDPAAAPVTLLALAPSEGCRVVLEAAGP